MFASKMKNEKDAEEFELAQYFIKTYSASRSGLQRMGILRSERSLQGDYAEWIVAKLLDLQLAESTIQKGFDAIDKDGKTYQIKCRLVDDVGQHTSWDFKTIDTEFDIFIGVFLSYDFDLLGMVKVSHEIVEELGVKTSNDFRFRWNKKVAGDSRIEKLFWSDEDEIGKEFRQMVEEVGLSNEVATTILESDNISESFIDNNGSVKITRKQMERTQLDKLITSTKKAITLVELMSKKLYIDAKQKANEAGFQTITYKTFINGQRIFSEEELILSKYSEKLKDAILLIGENAGINREELLEEIERARTGNDYLNYLYLRACRYMNGVDLLDNRI